MHQFCHSSGPCQHVLTMSLCLITQLCRRQKGVLDQLDSQVSVAERRRQEAEAEAKQLEDVKVMMAL